QYRIDGHRARRPQTYSLGRYIQDGGVPAATHVLMERHKGGREIDREADRCATIAIFDAHCLRRWNTRRSVRWAGAIISQGLINLFALAGTLGGIRMQ